MEDDCLYRNYSGPLAVNDYIVFHNVGAYTIVLKPPFIVPAPPILAESAAVPGKFETVRRQESFDDVFATYVFDPEAQRGRGSEAQTGKVTKEQSGRVKR